MTSAVMTAQLGSNGSGRAGISLDLSATRRRPATTPLARPGADRKWGPVRAPRMVLPSTAITLRSAMVPVRVKNHEASAGVETRGVQIL